MHFIFVADFISQLHYYTIEGNFRVGNVVEYTFLQK